MLAGLGKPGADPNRICIFRQHKRDSRDADSNAAPHAALR
jgi:hypothetical protein